MEEEVISSKVFFIALVVLPSCHGNRAAGAVAVVYSGISVVTLIHERVVGGKKWRVQMKRSDRKYKQAKRFIVKIIRTMSNKSWREDLLEL